MKLDDHISGIFRSGGGAPKERCDEIVIWADGEGWKDLPPSRIATIKLELLYQLAI